MNSKLLKDIFTIAVMKAMPDLKRQPMVLLLIGLVSSLPLFFIVVYGANIGYGLIGAMVSSVSFIGLTAAIQDIAIDRYLKIREIIVAMPVQPVGYALGVALAPLILATPSLVIFMSLALWTGGLTIMSLLSTSIALILCWIATSSIGFLISTYLQKAPPFVLSNLSNILGLLLCFIPPVYYPEESLGILRPISAIFPTSNTVSLIRVYSGSLDLSLEATMARWFVLIFTAAFFVALTAAKAKWREP